ncbi:HTTM domain-containing protein [Aeromicrobium sp.]|uniref:HTTM domain-containing protein n=1 Tax=Aeromicrobium sp. TaxID=1871063 RepID=UPI003C6A8212
MTTEQAIAPDPVDSEAPSRSVASRGLDLINDWYDSFESWLLTDKRSLYGASLARILAGCSVLGILTTNFRVRNLLFGQASVWNKPLQDRGLYWQPKLVDHLGNTTFLFYYLFVMILAVLFILGWHTRFIGPLMLIGHISIIERIPVLGDQGDNILRVGLLLLMFMHTSEYWSLDARRRAATDVIPVGGEGGRVNLVALGKNLWNSQQVLPRWLTNGLHNVVLIALAWQVIIIYFSAGLFKVQGALWQHGTALYYPLQLQEYKPFPFLTDLFTHVGVIVGLSTYAAVLVQIGFAFALLHPVARRIAIFCAIMFHLAIAVLMALPWFSLSMIAFDAIFVSTSTFVLFDKWIRVRMQPVADLFWDVADPLVERLPAGLRR